MTDTPKPPSPPNPPKPPPTPPKPGKPPGGPKGPGRSIPTTYGHAELTNPLDAAYACGQKAGPRDSHAPSQHGPSDGWHHVVYQVADADGRVIYVGRSSQFPLRMRYHQLNTPWWHEVASMHIWQLPCHGQACTYETQRIHAELPKYNSVGVRNRKAQVAS